MEIKLDNKNETHVLTLRGELDLYNAPKLKSMSTMLIDSKAMKIVIDMKNVDYIDSTGVGVLLNIHTATKKNGTTFFLTNVHGTVEKVFRLTRLLGFLPIRDKLEDVV